MHANSNACGHRHGHANSRLRLKVQSTGAYFTLSARCRLAIECSVGCSLPGWRWGWGWGRVWCVMGQPAVLGPLAVCVVQACSLFSMGCMMEEPQMQCGAAAACLLLLGGAVISTRACDSSSGMAVSVAAWTNTVAEGGARGGQVQDEGCVSAAPAVLSPKHGGGALLRLGGALLRPLLLTAAGLVCMWGVAVVGLPEAGDHSLQRYKAAHSTQLGSLLGEGEEDGGEGGQPQWVQGLGGERALRVVVPLLSLPWLTLWGAVALWPNSLASNPSGSPAAHRQRHPLWQSPAALTLLACSSAQWATVTWWWLLRLSPLPPDLSLTQLAGSCNTGGEDSAGLSCMKWLCRGVQRVSGGQTRPQQLQGSSCSRAQALGWVAAALVAVPPLLCCAVLARVVWRRWAAAWLGLAVAVCAMLLAATAGPLLGRGEAGGAAAGSAHSKSLVWQR